MIDWQFLYRTIGCCWLAVFLPLASYAQVAEENATATWRWGIEAAPYLSYSGVNFRIAGCLQKDRHQWYAGPKIVASDSYLPGQGPWGIQTGYRYYLVRENRWQAFVNLDYQLSWYAPYNPLGLEVDRNNRIHEGHLSFGVFYQLNKHWRLGSQIGSGIYLEQNQDLVVEKTRSYSGYSNLIALFVTYER